MKCTKVSLLVTIGMLIKKYNKNWTYASQAKFIKLLETFHKSTIKRRQLCYHLADLRSAGLIVTQQRKKRNPDGTLCVLSSATCLTIEGCRRLCRLGFVWARIQMRKLIKKYGPESAKQRPLSIDPYPFPEYRTEPKVRREDNPFLVPALAEEHGFKYVK